MATTLLVAVLFSLIVLLVSTTLYFNIKINSIIVYLSIVCIFFPVHIRFIGRDALTTGTVFIFALFLIYIAQSFRKGIFFRDKYDYLLYLLILFGTLSIFFPIWKGTLNTALIGPAIRLYAGFLGSILLFIIIKNFHLKECQSNFKAHEKQVENLLTLFLFLITIHILISISINYFPSLNSVFKIFYTRDVDVIDFSRGGSMEIGRMRNFSLSTEEYGEILAALSPVIIYKIYKFRNPIWFFCLFLFFTGLILSVTRSGILLFMAGAVYSFLYYSRKYFIKTFLLINLIVTVLFLIAFLFPSSLNDTIIRFTLAKEAYTSSGDILEIINRSGVFIPAWETTISNLTVFGNGITEFHFHNLYLTTLHQKGIFGTTIFFIVLLFPAVRLIKSYKKDISANKPLIFSFLLSIALFLVNETKFEFTRGSTYQQIWWGLFGVYYLVADSVPEKIKEKNLGIRFT